MTEVPYGAKTINRVQFYKENEKNFVPVTIV